jgi:large subunit ribosomal protein L25
MSERSTITAETRTVIGKQVKQLRREGWIPAVIYGQNDPDHIQLDNLTLRRVLREAGTTSLIDIDLNGRSRTVLAREISLHPTRKELYHVDFLEVNLRRSITSEAVLVATGEAPAAADGEGSVMLLIHSVAFEALPDDLISEIPVDISKIATAEDIIYVSDLPVPAGVTILTDLETAVAKFQFDQREVEEEEEVAVDVDAEGVEVIARGKDDEDDAEAKSETEAETEE